MKRKVTSALKTRFNLLKRLAQGEIGNQVTKKLTGEEIKYVSLLYKEGVSRVKVRIVRNAFN